MEQPGRARRVALIVLGVAVAVAAAVAVGVRRARAPRPAAAGPVVVPGDGPGGRVEVEVLNASGRVGLARAATRRLRQAGLDVVFFGSDTTQGLDSTQVLVRRGPGDAARRVEAALGAGAVRAAPDSGRLVDVTVRLGRDFAAVLGQP